VQSTAATWHDTLDTASSDTSVAAAAAAAAVLGLQIFFSLLGVLMARHSKALLPTWQAALDTAGQRASNSLQQQLAAVAASGTGTDARFKAYVGLLLGLINVSVQVGWARTMGAC
jgi:hypothetical protein